MLKQIAKLKVDTSEDYNDKLVKAISKAGFTVVMETECGGESFYIIADGDNDEYDSEEE